MVELECRSCSAAIPIGGAPPGTRILVECAFCGSRYPIHVPVPTGLETVYYPQALADRDPDAPIEPPPIDPRTSDPDYQIPSGTALLIPGRSLRKAVAPENLDTLKRASLVVEGPKGASMPLAGTRTEVGRKGAHIVIADPALSASHFVIEVIGETYVIRDLGSSNGTRLNGHPIRSARLEPGDTIDASETRFSFRIEETIPWQR